MTKMTIASAISALTGPFGTRATRTATEPARNDPMIGMNAPRKTSAASGMTRGTPSTARPMPMPIASISATAAVART